MLHKNIIPNFEKGRIVKKEALDNLRDFPRECMIAAFYDYTSGIIAGLDISMEKDQIIISPGILKHGQHMFILKAAETLLCEIYNEKVVVLLCIYPKADKNENIDFEEIYWEFKLESYSLINSSEYFKSVSYYEIASFMLEKGALLRSYGQYLDMKDISTEYNTLNQINCIYAGQEQSTFSPKILKFFAKKMFKKNCLDTLDLIFCSMCLNSSRVDRTVILQYVSSRMKKEYETLNNLEIFQLLCEIYKITDNQKSLLKSNLPNWGARTLID